MRSERLIRHGKPCHLPPPGKAHKCGRRCVAVGEDEICLYFSPPRSVAKNLHDSFQRTVFTQAKGSFREGAVAKRLRESACTGDLIKPQSLAGSFRLLLRKIHLPLGGRLTNVFVGAPPWGKMKFVYISRRPVPSQRIFTTHSNALCSHKPKPSPVGEGGPRSGG